ncbi:MAG: Fic family protein [Thiopseudomonas sp.]
MASYAPPLTITPHILNRVAGISEQLGRFAERKQQAQALRLRRANRIRTIQGSLAIEGNSLSLEQITAVLEGRPVIAPPREVQEVKNALAVYERFPEFDPQLEADLLHAHKQLMLGLMDETGCYRSGGVGVMSGKQVIHMAPPASQVSRLMSELFAWLQTTEQHPLIASAVFHYEFEFIHPFADGNGRMGRLWQSLILAKWNPIFAHLPVESLVHQQQQAYYAAIAQSTAAVDCAPFVEFMLDAIWQALLEGIGQEAAGEGQVRLESQLESRLESKLAARLLLCLAKSELGKAEMARELGHQSVSGELHKQVRRLVELGVIAMTLPDKPSSRLQKYRLTEQGRELLLADEDY